MDTTTLFNSGAECIIQEVM